MLQIVKAIVNSYVKRYLKNNFFSSLANWHCNIWLKWLFFWNLLFRSTPANASNQCGNFLFLIKKNNFKLNLFGPFLLKVDLMGKRISEKEKILVKSCHLANDCFTKLNYLIYWIVEFLSTTWSIDLLAY